MKGKSFVVLQMIEWIEYFVSNNGFWIVVAALFAGVAVVAWWLWQPD